VLARTPRRSSVTVVAGAASRPARQLLQSIPRSEPLRARPANGMDGALVWAYTWRRVACRALWTQLAGPAAVVAFVLMAYVVRRVLSTARPGQFTRRHTGSSRKPTLDSALRLVRHLPNDRSSR